MRILRGTLPIIYACSFHAATSFGQTSPATKPDTDVQILQKQMLELQAGLQQLKTQHQEEIAGLKAQIEQQQKVIEDLQKAGPAQILPPMPAKTAEPSPGTKPADTLFPTTDPSLVAPTTPPPPGAPGAAGGPLIPTTDDSVVPGGPGPAAPAAATTPPSLTGPITIAGGGKSYMNISFDGMFTLGFSSERELDRLEVGDHDPQQRGFNARNLELALDGAIDPYFEGFANIVFKLDNNNETEVEAEEAFLQTTALPWGLQLKGGQFFAAFGRINAQHPHVWDFADAPLVQGLLLGEDGLRGVGAQVSWVLPTPWFSQFSLGMQNGNGGTGFSFRNPGEDGTFLGRQTVDRKLRGLQDFVFIPRLEASFDLSPTRTLLFGASAALGPNDTGSDVHTQIYGADVFYKWKPANAEGGFPFVKWQSEAMVRRFEAGRGADNSFPARETFTDWGAYSQVVWGFRKGWTVGVRGDYVHFEDSEFTDDEDRQSRWRLSTELTWYPSEFSKLRLQYNHDFLQHNSFLNRDDADSVFLQFEFALGSHSAHKF